MSETVIIRDWSPATRVRVRVSFALTNWIGVLLALIVIVMLWRDRVRKWLFRSGTPASSPAEQAASSPPIRSETFRE